MLADTKALHIPASFESLDASRFRRLDEVTIGVFDCPHSTPKLADHGPLVVRTQDIMTGVLRVDQAARVSEETYQERIDRVEPEFGDLLYSREGTYFGIAAEVPSGTRLCLGQRMVLIRPDRAKVDHRYLKYWLNSPQIAGHIHGFRDGSVAERLNLPVIRGLPVYVPELDVQKAIAETLGALDDKIEQNRRTSRALEALARATFKAWFVDFEPVKAKAAGQTSFPGMPPAAFAALPDRLTDSPLGPMPNGWKAGSLGDVVGLLQGFAFKSKDWTDRGVPVVKIGSVKPGVVDLNAVSFVSEEIAADASKYRLAAGDLLIGMTGYVGEVGLVPPTENLPLLNQRVSKVTLESPGTRHLGFAYCFMRREEFKAQVEAKSHGTAQANVSAAGILSVPLVIPPQVAYDSFNLIAKGPLDLMLAGFAESFKLVGLRDYLLPRLLTGQVRVSAAEQLIGGTL